jgi:hypothetical protein
LIPSDILATSLLRKFGKNVVARFKVIILRETENLQTFYVRVAGLKIVVQNPNFAVQGC